jgi:hypothetical protein
MENLTCNCIVSKNNNREITGGAKPTCGYTWKPLLLLDILTQQDKWKKLKILRI